jgi:Ni/Co efflux regulator RcnB
MLVGVLLSLCGMFGSINMRKLVLTGLVAGLGGFTAPAVQAQEAGNLAVATSVMNQGATYAGSRAGRHGAWGQRVNGRWSAGWNAPGGWDGYRRPVAGVSLPGYWINPAYYIADYRGYGLPAPASGYGWSRYYDDAVLTDRYGRVIGARYGYDWDRYGGYDDGYDNSGYDYRQDDRRRSNGNGVAGAVVGGLIGGVAGSAIAGKGDRIPGAIIGAGVGAVAGGAIGSASGRGRSDGRYDAPGYGYPGDGAPGYGGQGYGGPGYDAPPPGAPGYTTAGRTPFYYGSPRGGEPYPYSDDAPSLNGRAAYDGQWVGTWYGRDGSTYSGTYGGQFKGKVRGNYDQRSYAPQPRPIPAPAYGYGYGYQYPGFGAATYSYEAVDYAAPTIMTTTVTTEEVVYATTVRKPIVRKARPRPRVLCTCSCRC